MDAELIVRCPAKLNLFLEVVRRRPDGYHDLDTVMQAIDLYDDLHIEPRPGPALTLECSDPSLPTDGRNLVIRAAQALRERAGCRGGAHLRLVKRIPSEAGLGGGSSDAAGAIAGLARAWRLGLSSAELADVAAAVGSDVAFFLTGGAAHCTGRGERVEPLAVRAGFHAVLLCPPVGVSTAAAYRELRFPLTAIEINSTMMRRALGEGSLDALGRCLFNRLEAPAFRLEPSLAEVKAQLAASPLLAGALMTGSGSAIFGLCRPDDATRARESAATLRAGPVCVVRSIDHGVRITRG